MRTTGDRIAGRDTITARGRHSMSRRVRWDLPRATTATQVASVFCVHAVVTDRIGNGYRSLILSVLPLEIESGILGVELIPNHGRTGRANRILTGTSHRHRR